MTLSLLAIPLLAAATQDGPAYLAALPQDSALVVTVHDLPELRETGSDNAWYRWLEDESVQRLIALLNESGGAPWNDAAWPEELPAAGELLTAIEGAAFALLPNGDGSAMGLVLAIEGRAQTTALETSLDVVLEDLGPGWRSSTDEYAGIELRCYNRDGTGSEDPFDPYESLVALRHGDVFALVADTDPGRAVTRARDAVQRLTDAGEPSNLLLDPRYAEARGSGGAQVEAFLLVDPMRSMVDLDDLPDELARAVMAAALDAEWAYAGVRVGRDEEMEMRYEMRFAPDGWLGRLGALLRPARHDLLRLVPRNAVSVTLASFDLAGLTDLVLETFEERAPDTYQAFEAGLSQFGAQADVDPIEDLLKAFTGEYATFQLALDELVIPEGSSEEEIEVLTSQGTGLVFGLHDGLAFVENLELVLEAAGVFGMVELDEFEGYDVYDLGSVTGVPIAFAVADDWFGYSIGRGALHAFLRSAANESAPSAQDNPLFTDSLVPVRGTSFVTVTDTAAMFGLFAQVFETAGFMNLGEDRAAAQVYGARLARVVSPEVIRRYFHGTLVSTVGGGPDRLVLRMMGR